VSEGRRRRSFTDDYKRQAVDLVASSGRSIGSVAKELGLRDSVLRRWVAQRRDASPIFFSDGALIVFVSIPGNTVADF